MAQPPAPSGYLQPSGQQNPGEKPQVGISTVRQPQSQQSRNQQLPTTQRQTTGQQSGIAAHNRVQQLSGAQPRASGKMPLYTTWYYQQNYATQLQTQQVPGPQLHPRGGQSSPATRSHIQQPPSGAQPIPAVQPHGQQINHSTRPGVQQPAQAQQLNHGQHPLHAVRPPHGHYSTPTAQPHLQQPPPRHSSIPALQPPNRQQPKQPAQAFRPPTYLNQPSPYAPYKPPVQQNPQPISFTNQVLQVTDYLKKKGFVKTEAIFRKETQNLGPDGRPANPSDESSNPKRYLKAFSVLRDWVDNSIDIYKFELKKLLWPVFIYSYYELIDQGYADEGKHFLNTLRPHFEAVHADTLKELASITLPQHTRENHTAKLYRGTKYRIPLNQTVSHILFHFLEREADSGGETIAYLLQTFCHIDSSARGPIEPFSFEAIYRRGQNIDLDEADLREGIPGAFTGVLNRDVLDTTAALKLGPLPMEPELRDDVRAELEEEDQLNPPAEGRPTLVEEFDRRIKREESADCPPRADLPLPQARARDVVMEMQRVRENRDRFKIEGRTGGAGVPVSVCMFTFHNTLGSVSSMDFSNDHQLVAVGTMDSYIRVWSLDGKPLKTKLPNEANLKVNNRKLIGHSAPVYGVSFSDSITNIDRNIYGDEHKVETDSKLLLSCSGDGQVRLWSLEYWTCLCIYKAHDGPVFRVLWSPHGHYFASAGWDKTVRVFAQDHASAQRILVGHDTPLSALTWHPNGMYIFSASDETDKSIRMWSITSGSCVRVFSGHADYISALCCAPNGKLLASADNGGNIFFWDVEKGTRIKRCRGHGKGGIPSLSFSAESNVLVSGGLDGTVRIWDVEVPADPAKANVLAGGALAAPTPVAPVAQQPADAVIVASDSIAVGGTGGSITVGGQPAAPTPAAPAVPVASSSAQAAAGVPGAGATGGTGKKKAKEVQITPDQISAFPTKKTPVLKVRFTRMNLVVAGGCFDPDR